MPEREPGHEEQEAVRRALADARHDGPVPDEVAARLDATLADLQQERHGVERAAPEESDAGPLTVDPGDRRRRATALLVAAAAVVAIGLGVVPALDTWTDRGTDRGEVSGTTAERDAGSEDGSGSAPGGSPREDDAREDPEVPAQGLTSAGPPPEIGAGGLAGRAEELQPRATSSDPRTDRDHPTGCGPAAGPGEDLLPVTYDGSDAVLLYRAPDGDARRVELHLCGADDGPARSATILAR